MTTHTGPIQFSRDAFIGDCKQPILPPGFQAAPRSLELQAQLCPQRRGGCTLEADPKALPTSGRGGHREHQAAVLLT